MSYLYAVRMQIPDYQFAPIKIGFSHNPERRVKEFTRGPFPILWLGRWPAPNGRADESGVHSRFAGFRLCGEWFYPAPELVEFVESALGEVESRALGAQKVAKFERRYSEMFPAPAPTTVPLQYSALLPDPFDASPFVNLEVENFISEIERRWPLVSDRPQWLRRREVAELVGMPERDVEKYISRLQPTLATKRWGWQHVKEFLTENPSYVTQLLLNRTSPLGLKAA